MKLSLWLRTLRMLFAIADDKSKPAATLERAERAVQIVEETVAEIERGSGPQPVADGSAPREPDPPPPINRP